MGIMKELKFVQDQIKKTTKNKKTPSGGMKYFRSKVGYAFSLAFKEKEIFVFALLQWATIGLVYLLWVQMLDWIPEDVWRSTVDSDSGSIADWVLLGWSFLCVGIAAFPIGILTGSMGATHFLHRQGRESTIAASLKLVLPQSWALWSFHWIDGWITVNQILKRLPSKNNHTSIEKRILDEALYYAWKLGIAGVLPSIVTGNNLIQSGKNSVIFVKRNFSKVARLRAGYSILCWIVGIGAYVGSFFLFNSSEIIPSGDEIYAHVYTFYLWAIVPMLIATAIIMLFLRPIYVLALCDLYSEHLEKKGEIVNLPDNPSKVISVLVTFMCLCMIVIVVYLYRNEIGITEMLAIPYG